MSFRMPINFKQWIDDNRHLLKPPVGNQVVYEDTEFIIMVVGGPNNRKDFHYNESEEFFYQLEGDIHLRLHVDGEIKKVDIREGEIFLLPPKVPHSPQRGADTVGLVVERKRREGEKDAFMWFCDNCSGKLYEEFMDLTDIVKQLPIVFENFYSSTEHRTCKSCGTVMTPPQS